MSTHDTALKLALVKVLSARLAAIKKTADQEVSDGWQVGDRTTAVLPDGTKVGTVTFAKGSTTARLSDDEAFLEWVLETHPEEIEQITITRVKPDFTERTLSFARQHGQPVDPATGEKVPGVTVVEGDPHSTTRLEGDAVALVSAAWRDGSLAELVSSLMQPAIEGGEQ